MAAGAIRAPSALVRRQNQPGASMVSGRWRGDRVADCARLESVCAARYRGFESHPLRHFFHLRCGRAAAGRAPIAPSARRWVRSHAMVRFRTGSGRERSSPKVLVPGARCPGPSARARPSPGPATNLPERRSVRAPRVARSPGSALSWGRMSYLVLARKYRPRAFSEVAGQDVVTRTLRGAIAEGRVGHAYLFFGPRGTGKTTSARLFAKALNCENGPAAEPCGECERCLSLRRRHGTRPHRDRRGVQHRRRARPLAP